MSTPRFLLLGRSGQLGWSLQRALAAVGTVAALDRADCDLAIPDQIRSAVRHSRPDVIVNAAAFTAVDKAESSLELAERVNAVAPQILAELAREHGSLLIHYSTDYVFDGKKSSAYVEADTPNPINAYGRTKLTGEQAIEKVGGSYIVFRTSWVYGLRGRNFPKTILKRAMSGEKLRVVDDEIGAPTSADLIADITAHCLAMRLRGLAPVNDLSGIFHLVASGETTWYEFACELVRLGRAAGFNIADGGIEATSAQCYAAAALRPANSRLSTEKLRQTFKVHLPPWQLHVARLVSELAEREVWPR